MTQAEIQIERRHIITTRFAILEAPAIPTAAQNNMASKEADEHIEAILRNEREEAIGPLLELRNSL